MTVPAYLSLPLAASLALGCAAGGSAPAGSAPAKPSVAQGPAWNEDFRQPLDWASPSRHGPELLVQVYRIVGEGDARYLAAAHDRGALDSPPAMHYGKGFDGDGPLISAHPRLRFRWRVRRHPDVTDDPWLDLAASVYVVIRQPTLIRAGRGFKLGWVAKSAPLGTRQRGLLQVPLRSDAASDTWHAEDVDICELYRETFGSCSGERLVYVGVMTDADNTKSVAEADYADFSLGPR